MPDHIEDLPTLTLDKAEATSSPNIKVSEHIRTRLEGWLDETLKARGQERNTRKATSAPWLTTLRGMNPYPAIRRGSSNVSVPLSLWAVSGSEARISRAILRPRVRFTLEPPRGLARSKRKDDITDPVSLGKKLTKVMNSLMRSPRALNGDETVKKAVADQCRHGLGAWMVRITPSFIKNLAPTDSTSIEPTRTVVNSAIRWEHIPFKDLIYWNGYGTDVSLMPFVGFYTTKIWSSILQWQKNGYYDTEAVKAIEAFYTRESNEQIKIAEMREHTIAELYLDYDINGDGLPESVVIDYHIEARKVLRISWNDFSGIRPIKLIQFDFNADTDKAQGQGVMEKLQSPQEEANALHNIAVEAAKRSSANLLILKSDSGAEEEIGGEESVLPGTVISTEDPDEDVVVRELGDAKAIEGAAMFESLNFQYAIRLIGLGPAQGGDVAAGKRVSASVGVPLLEEGRTVLDNATQNVANALEDSVYLTIDAMRNVFPLNSILNILDDPAEAQALAEAVFNLTADTARDSFLVTAAVRDNQANMQETRMGLFQLNQFMMAFYEKLAGLAMPLAAPETPPEVKALLKKMIEKMTNTVDKFVETFAEVEDTDDLLFTMSELNEALQGQDPNQEPAPDASIPGPPGF